MITAFRVAYGGAQTLLSITPDLTTLGKAIGGGVALGAYGGRADVMDFVAPLGPAYQAGTLAGNPLSVQVGRSGSMFTLYFTDLPVSDYAGAQRSDPDRFTAMFRRFLDRGVLLAPSRFEAWMISIQHTRRDLDDTLDIADAVFAQM